MTEIQRLIDVPGLPATRSLAYANVVTAGDLIFVAGQAGVDEQGRLVSTEFVPHAQRTFENIGQLAYPEMLVEVQCTAVRHD